MKITMKRYNVRLIGWTSRWSCDVTATDEHGAVHEAIAYWTVVVGRDRFEVEAGMEFEVTEL